MSARSMKAETLRKRLGRERPMTSITLRMPEDEFETFRPRVGGGALTRA